MAYGPRKKPLDFGDNPDHITLGLGYRVRVVGLAAMANERHSDHVRVTYIY